MRADSAHEFLDLHPTLTSEHPIARSPGRGNSRRAELVSERTPCAYAPLAGLLKDPATFDTCRGGAVSVLRNGRQPSVPVTERELLMRSHAYAPGLGCPHVDRHVGDQLLGAAVHGRRGR